MISDSIFTVHRFAINVEKLNEPIYLIPFGDMHRFAPLCDVEKWFDFLKWAKTKPNSFYLGMGDYDDLASFSERKALLQACLHESTQMTLDELFTSRVNRLYDEISFMQGRLIGLIEGNHHGILQSGMTTTQMMCDKLKTKYLGVSSFIRLSFAYGHKRASVDIWAHHGKGASRLLGSSLNTVEQMEAIADADIFCVDETTEILTIDGFKKIGDVNIGDKVYSLNLKTNKIEKDVAKDVIISNYNGNMYHIQNSSCDMLLSPNHRVLYKQNNPSNHWLFKPVSNFFYSKSSVRLPMAGLYGDGVNLSDNQIALTGWIISEGSFCSSGIIIAQKSEEKSKIIEDIIIRCGYKYTKRKRSDNLNSFYIVAAERKRIDFIKEKNIPDWVFELDKRQFDILLKHLVLGDGYAYNNNSGAYFSGNEDLINRLQIALTLHGYRSFKQYNEGGFKYGGWSLHYCNRELLSTYLVKNKKDIINYSGKIWCINTQNTTMICRRNHKVFITGNCMGHDHKKSVAFKTKLYLTNGKESVKLNQHKILIGRTGSFLKGYVDNAPSYIARGAMTPTDLGVLKIELTPKRSCKNGGDVFYIDLHCSI